MLMTIIVQFCTMTNPSHHPLTVNVGLQLGLDFLMGVLSRFQNPDAMFNSNPKLCSAYVEHLLDIGVSIYSLEWTSKMRNTCSTRITQNIYTFIEKCVWANLNTLAPQNRLSNASEVQARTRHPCRNKCSPSELWSLNCITIEGFRIDSSSKNPSHQPRT